MSERALKKKVLALLKSPNFERAEEELDSLPGRELLHALFSGICATDDTLRWRAIIYMGKTVAKIADQDMEAARVVMRRLMWSLNDESGGIGWGAPEAFAEILCCHEELAKEYAHILVSYMREDGNFLEHIPLQRGLLWGIGRLARARNKLLLSLNAPFYLLPYFESPDASIVGLSAWAAGGLPDEKLAKTLAGLTQDQRQIRCFTSLRFRETTVGHLAADSIEAIKLKLMENQ